MLGAATGNDAGGRPPTPAMKRFADSLARQRGIKPPPGYKTSMSICRAFLNQHAPKKADGESGRHDAKAGGPAHIVAEETARDGNVGISTQAAVSLAAIPEPIDGNPKTKRRKRVRKTTSKPNLSTAPKSTARTAREDARPMVPLPQVHQRRSARFGGSHAAADSLRQQGSRPAPWRPLWREGMVCPARSRSFGIRRARMAVARPPLSAILWSAPIVAAACMRGGRRHLAPTETTTRHHD